MVMSSAVHVCWKKAALYFEIEERYCECTPEQTINPHEAVDLVDGNTILVCAIMGTTYLGNYEDVQKLNELLGEKNKKEGLDVTIHVDAAGGGFVAPFIRPNLIWDFRLPLVCSINTSGHKCTSGYRSIMTALVKKAGSLAEAIVSVAGGGKFVLMSRTEGNGLPIVVWRLKDEAKYDGKVFIEIPYYKL
ncbi:unnamed protein product [Penicillium viridicatum]